MRRPAWTVALLATLATASLTVPADADHSIANLLSIGPAGGNGPYDVHAYTAAMTPDGRHVFFSTREALTPDDTDSAEDVYRSSGGALTRVSTGPTGGNGPEAALLGDRSELDGFSGHRQRWYGIADDGETAVFITSEQLVAEDADASPDLYKWSAGTTTLVTIGSNEECVTQRDRFSCVEFGGMSRDGRHVFFNSGDHLAAGAEETRRCQGLDNTDVVYRYPCYDVYEHVDGAVRLLSTGPSDPRGREDHRLSANSADGSVALFESRSQLLPEDVDDLGTAVIDVYQRDDGVLSLVSRADDFSPQGALFTFLSEDGDTVLLQSGGRLWEVSGGVARQRTHPDVRGFISFNAASADAEHVFYATRSALVPGDTDTCVPGGDPAGCIDVYEHSFASGTRLVTTGAHMSDADHNSGYGFSTTHDGSKAFFETQERLDPADTDDEQDVFERDLASGTTKLVSTGPIDFGGSHRLMGVSADGARVFFYTEAALVPQDTNGVGDIYERAGNTTSIVTMLMGWDGGLSTPPPEFLSYFDGQISRDGSVLVINDEAGFAGSDADGGFRDVFAISRGELGGYPRPKWAPSTRVALVPAAAACTAPDRTHGPPLAFPSCSPPVPRSPHLNAGVGGVSPFPARFSGQVALDLLTGTPGGSDDSDVRVRVRLSSVWRQSGVRADYTGGLQARIGLRVTDRDGAIPNTVQDSTLAVNIPCTATTDDNVGSVCTVRTSADAVSPGIVPEGRRTVWALDQVQVVDGGPDGNVRTNPAANEVFAVQGVFVP